MIITRVVLRNWMNFTHVDVQLTRRMFLVGPNASGKSNFLDAIRFLKHIAREGGGLSDALRERGNLSSIRCLSAANDPGVGLAIELGDAPDAAPIWRYELELEREQRGLHRPKVQREAVYRNGVLILKRPDDDDQADNARLTQTHLEQVNSNQRFREVATFLASIDYAHLVPQLVRNPERFTRSGHNGADPYGLRFLDHIAATPQNRQAQRLQRIEDALRAAVPQLKQLTLTRDTSGVPHLQAIYEHWHAHGAQQREDKFSDGTIRLIGLLWTILDTKAVLLLEEPELSLHVAIVKRLPGVIYRMMRGRERKQVLMSTHSWDMLDDRGISAHEVLVFEPNEQPSARKGTTITRVADVDYLRSLIDDGQSIAEAALSRTEPREIQKLLRFE